MLILAMILTFTAILMTLIMNWSAPAILSHLALPLTLMEPPASHGLMIKLLMMDALNGVPISHIA
jgi:hypothetical protein